MVVELSVRLQHHCPFLEFSSHFGKKALYHYCSSFNDYLVIPGKLTDEQKELVQRYFGRFENLYIKEIGKNLDLTYVIIDCPGISENFDIVSSSIDQKMRKLKAIPIYPITYQYGYEYYTLYCKNIETADNFIKKMKSGIVFEVLSSKDLGNEWVVTQTAVLKQLFDELTPVQVDILKQAYEKGYYNIPREIKTEDLAQKNKKSRYAIEKNIRSAENKILNYIMPFMYLHESELHIKPVVIEKLPDQI